MSSKVEADGANAMDGDPSVICDDNIFVAVLEVGVFDEPFPLCKEVSTSARVCT